MTISIHASAFDVNSWYQKITLTFINESGNAVDMNHAAISFTASGHIDPWGNSGGTLKGNLPLTLNDSSYGTLKLTTSSLITAMHYFFSRANAGRSLSASRRHRCR